MIAVEDKRFRSHVGVDPIGIAPLVQGPSRHRPLAQGGSTITQQLARNIFLTNSRTFGRKVKEGVLALALERKFSQGPDPRALPEPRLFRRRRLWHRCRLADLLRPRRRSSEPGRSRDHRRTGQGAVQLFPDRRRRGRARRARTSCCKRWPRTASSAGAGGTAVDPGADPDPADDQAKQRPLLHRLGAAAARYADRRDAGTRSTSGRRSIPACSRPPTARSHANAPAGAQGALVAIDRDGAVRAMVGGKDYVDSIYNRATQADAPAGLGVQAVRLPDRARIGDEADRHDRRRAGHHRWLDARATRPAPTSGRSLCAKPFRARSTRSAPRSAPSSVSATIADMARRFGISTPISTYPVDGPGNAATCG